MRKIGLKTLIKNLERICVFMAKHRIAILNFIGTDNAALYDAVTEACIAFTSFAEPLIPPGV